MILVPPPRFQSAGVTNIDEHLIKNHMVFLMIFMVFPDPELLPGNGFYAWLLPLLVLIIAQELLGRLLFYSTYFRIGV